MKKVNVAQQERPVPPTEGWTLLQAVTALCPAATYFATSAESSFDRAIKKQARAWDDISSYYFSREYYLARQLLMAIKKRPDLELTGYNLAKTLSGTRVKIAHALIVVSYATWLNDPNAPGYFFGIYVGSDRLVIHYVSADSRLVASAYSDAEKQELLGVRVETTNSEHLRVPDDSVSKPKYSHSACIQWLKTRVAEWPLGKPAPIMVECLAAAKSYFSGEIPRDEFRQLRRSPHVPDSWCKPGPRSPRSPRI